MSFWHNRSVECHPLFACSFLPVENPRMWKSKCGVVAWVSLLDTYHLLAPNAMHLGYPIWYLGLSFLEIPAWPRGAMDSAYAYGAWGSRFDPWRGRRRDIFWFSLCVMISSFFIWNISIKWFTMGRYPTSVFFLERAWFKKISRCTDQKHQRGPFSGASPPIVKYAVSCLVMKLSISANLRPQQTFFLTGCVNFEQYNGILSDDINTTLHEVYFASKNFWRERKTLSEQIRCTYKVLLPAFIFTHIRNSVLYMPKIFATVCA